MSLYLLQGSLEEGLIYALVALGLLVSYSILDIADMTTDGTFVLGCAVSSMVVLRGINPWLALVLAIAAGAVAGFVTAFLQTRLGVPSILAGIIVMTALYSVNLMVQGGAGNISIGGTATIFSQFEAFAGKDFAVLLPMLLLIAIISVGLVFFFTTRIGLSIRATGDNRAMVQASSINPRLTVTIGLCLSNGLVALAGALWAQKNHESYIDGGTGVVVIGLASLALGNLFFRRRTIVKRVIAATIGAVLYRLLYAVALRYTSNTGYLKMVSAIILTLIMAYPTVKKYIDTKRHHRKEQKAYADTQ